MNSGFPVTDITNDKSADSAIAALPTYDWQDEAFRTASIQNYELSAAGGNDKTTFRVSGSYSFQEAIVTKADFKRGTLKFDLSNKATDKLTINTSVNLSTFNQNSTFCNRWQLPWKPRIFISTDLSVQCHI